MDNPIYLIFSAISLLIAISVHEFAHALAADKLGDPTPRSQGRLTLNPLKHLDPLGTLALLFFHFGWGKPVPVDPYNFQKPRRDELLTALAGPLSNIIIFFLTALLLPLLPQNYLLLSFFFVFAQLNLVLAIFNLIPIPPLDGSKIFLNLLPLEQSQSWEQAFSRYGNFLLIAAILIPVFNGKTIFDLVLTPLLSFFMTTFLGL